VAYRSQSFSANAICEIANLIDRRNADALFLCQRPISRALSETLTQDLRENETREKPEKKSQISFVGS
jgi:hypothetical protein